MYLTVCIDGLNLEKLLRAAAAAGVTLFDVRRIGLHQVYAQVIFGEYGKLKNICAAHGWRIRQMHAGIIIRCGRFLKRRQMLLWGLALCVLLVRISSGMILRIRIDYAEENEAEVRRFLAEERVQPGRFKSAFSVDVLRERLAFRLPGITYAGLTYEGSTLVVDCRSGQIGEMPFVSGDGMEIVAAQDGIITRISVESGTPLVKPGDAVCRGQVLVGGYERSQQGGMISVKAQAQVMARVWAKGCARARMEQIHTVETGDLRRSVVVRSPWHERIVRSAEPFPSQDVSVERQMVVGLYLPLWREITTYARTVTHEQPRARSDAASWAQGAAEEIAKKQCPFDALILDKWVDYSMIDNEFLYATVVLEYETSIAGRLK